MRFYTTVFIILFTKFIIAQEPKPPVANDDYAETIQGGLVSIPVLENDFGEEGHKIVVFVAGYSDYATTQKTDSTVIYIPKKLLAGYYSYPPLDTIYYSIKDLNNELVSEYAAIYVTILETDFDKVRDSLSLNNYNVSFNAYGNYFFDHFGNWRSKFEIPKGTGRYTILNRVC